VSSGGASDMMGTKQDFMRFVKKRKQENFSFSMSSPLRKSGSKKM